MAAIFSSPLAFENTGSSGFVSSLPSIFKCLLHVWHVKKHPSIGKDSILNYRRVDPINEKEKSQNDEVLRILEKNGYIEEEISKEEYLERKKEFEDIEYHPRKCEVCGSEEFEFISTLFPNYFI